MYFSRYLLFKWLVLSNTAIIISRLTNLQWVSSVGEFLVWYFSTKAAVEAFIKAVLPQFTQIDLMPNHIHIISQLQDLSTGRWVPWSFKMQVGFPQIHISASSTCAILACKMLVLTIQYRFSLWSASFRAPSPPDTLLSWVCHLYVSDFYL